MTKRKYERYVQTDCWKLRRARYLKLQDRCEVCQNHVELDVHHLSYERLGEERDSDLIAVCRDCHALLHELPSARSLKFAITCLGSLVNTQRDAGLKVNPKYEAVLAKLERMVA